MNKIKNTSQIVRAAIVIAMGIVMPVFFHIFGQGAGAVFLPMHIPILIGGFMLNPMYALLTGIITPVLSHSFTGMPSFPIVYVMILELGTYGFTISLLYNKFRISIYPSLILSMLIGRIVNILGVYGIIHMFIGKPFSLKVVVAGLVIKGFPGIIVQLVFVPSVVYALKKNFSLKIN